MLILYVTKKQSSSEESPTRLGEFGSAIMQIAEEKGIPKEKVIETVEAALAAAYKKDYGKRGRNIRAKFDEKTGSAKFFLVKEVVDETTRELADEKTEPARNTSQSDAGGELKNRETEEQRNKETKKLKDKETKKQKNRRTEKQKDKETGELAEEEKKLPRYNPERDLTLNEAKKISKNAKAGDMIETELEPKGTLVE